MTTLSDKTYKSVFKVSTMKIFQKVGEKFSIEADFIPLKEAVDNTIEFSTKSYKFGLVFKPICL
jgi:hypothetical protein